MKLKSLGYVLLFLGLLATELIKDADAATQQQKNLCTVFGDVAYRVSVLRDDGTNKYETRTRVYRNVDPSVQEAVLVVVEHVYKRPWYEPAEEANKVVGECIRLLEEEEVNTW